jgi:hypothetical protein
VFTELIDHPRHIGFAYDMFGELLKLHISQFFVRPKADGTTCGIPTARGPCPTACSRRCCRFKLSSRCG